jgi:hypothetical protein
MELDLLITSSSRPQLFPYCWESWKKMIHFTGLLNVYVHEDFVFPEQSKEVIKYLTILKESGEIRDFTYHNPSIGLGKSMDYMFKHHIKSKYMFYLQEDWEFERPIDMNQLIWVMEENEHINMIGLNKIRNTGSLNGSEQTEHTYSGVDMILYHSWSFMPGLWRMPFVKKHWRVREVRPEGFFTNTFGSHEQRSDCEYCKNVIGAYMLGKTGDFRYVRHIGNDWRMAHWRLENGKPGGVHDENRMDLPYRAPWLGDMPYRPVQNETINENKLNEQLSENPKEF